MKKLERDAARLEANLAMEEYLQGLVSYGYVNAAVNVWQDRLDEWEESMR